MEERIQEMIDYMEETKLDDIKRLSPKDRLNYLLACYDFFLPRMQRINFRPTDEEAEKDIKIMIVE